jgi:hypothetical protein
MYQILSLLSSLADQPPSLPASSMDFHFLTGKQNAAEDVPQF